MHRTHHAPNAVQLSTLLSIKTGGCPEDCGYCPQARRYRTGVDDEAMLDLDTVLNAASMAKAHGATRFCMGAAWRGPKQRDLEPVLAMVRGVKALGLETCATLGMLKDGHAEQLKDAGLDYYNHNLDSAPEFYNEIIHTREYQDRLDTLGHVRDAGLKTCCGGIVGMGESRAQRAGLLHTLATLPAHPDSVPINRLVQVAGTPLAGTRELDPFEFVRTIAVARIVMPKSMVRLSAGRAEMSDELQALCFLAGANSIFYGEKLLTTGNPDTAHDQALFTRLGIHAMLLAPLLYRDERARLPRIALALGVVIVAGVALMQGAHFHGHLGRDAWLALASVALSAFLYPLGNRAILLHLERSGEVLNATQRVFGMTLASQPFWWIVAAGAGQVAGVPPLQQIGLAAGVALLTGTIATILFFQATAMVQDDPAALGAVEAMQAAELLFSSALGVAFLGEAPPQGAAALGALLVVAGIVGLGLLVGRTAAGSARAARALRSDRGA